MASDREPTAAELRDTSRSRIRDLEQQLAAVTAERDRLREESHRRDFFESQCAMACDHMNTWAREWSVAEGLDVFTNEFCLRSLAERLWLKAMERSAKMSAEGGA